MSTLFQDTREAVTSAQHAVMQSSQQTAANLAQAANLALLAQLAQQAGKLAEQAAASKLLSATRGLTTTAKNDHQTSHTAGMFSSNRPGFSSVERTGAHQTKQQAQDSTPSVSPTT